MSRMPETWIGPGRPDFMYVELIDLRPSDDAAGPRAQIPLVGRQCVSWLKVWNGGDALVELAEPGRVRILPWQPFAEQLIERCRELSGDDSDGEHFDELLFLAERYRRVRIEKNGRLPFHDRELLHLGLGPDTGWLTLLVCMPRQLEFWNEEFRRQWRQRSRHRPPWDTDAQ